MNDLAALCRHVALALALAGAGLMVGQPAAAQIENVDPDMAIDGDLSSAQETAPQPPSLPAPTYDSNPETLPPAEQTVPQYGQQPVYPAPAATSAGTSAAASQASADPAAAAERGDTYKKDDLIGAAEGVFGKGAEGLARMIEDILSKQGEPNAYIVGREGGGAFIFGARYGSGTLYHKVEGQQPVYWRGPSLGIDFGANAANTFVLVYNLYNTQDLFETYAAGEGQAYLVGGFNVSYLRRGDVVLIPVRAGAGLRLGVNVGYMKFSKKQKWVPF